MAELEEQLPPVHRYALRFREQVDPLAEVSQWALEAFERQVCGRGQQRGSWCLRECGQ